jgi:prepilin-type processing-associated H-X9-DG protein
MDLLNLYVNDDALFICPSETSQHSPWNTEVPTDYGYSFCRIRSTKSNGIHHVSQYAVLLDWPVSCIKDVATGCDDCPLDHGWTASRTPSHNSRINILYYDGHVDSQKALAIQQSFQALQLPIYNR